MHAVARLHYATLIDNIQVSWVKMGVAGSRRVLAAGANDLGGTLMDENISRAAGAQHGQGVTAADFMALVEPLGRTLVQRNTTYDHLAVTSGGETAAAPAAVPGRKRIAVLAES